jgi:AcrR family transcriptional regulator
MVHSEDIKQAALYLFAYKGYAATSMQDIAEAVGIKKPSIYSHFKSKSEIFLTLLEDQARKFTNTVKVSLEEMKATEMKEILYQVFNANMQLYADRRNLLFFKQAVLLSTGIADEDIEEKLKEIMKNVNMFVMMSLQKTLSANGINVKSMERGMFQFMLFLQGYLDWMLVSDTHRPIDTRAAWEDFWNGMEKLPPA